MAVARPPASRISRSTVLMVDCCELGSGGKGFVMDASLVDFAAMTTTDNQQVHHYCKAMFPLLVYPFFAKSMATCLPIPREAPTTRATC